MQNGSEMKMNMCMSVTVRGESEMVFDCLSEPVAFFLPNTRREIYLDRLDKTLNRPLDVLSRALTQPAMCTACGKCSNDLAYCHDCSSYKRSAERICLRVVCCGTAYGFRCSRDLHVTCDWLEMRQRSDAMEEGVVHTPLLRWRNAPVRRELIRHIIFERVDHPNLQ